MIFKSAVVATAIALVAGGAAAAYAKSGLSVNLNGKADPANPNYKVGGTVTITVSGRCSVSVDGIPIPVEEGDRVTVTIHGIEPGGAYKGTEGERGAFSGFKFKGSVKVNGHGGKEGIIRIDCSGKTKFSGVRASLVVIGTTTLRVNSDTWRYPGDLELGDRIDISNLHDWFGVYLSGGTFRGVGIAGSVKINGHNVPELPLPVVAAGGLGAAALLEGRIRGRREGE